VRRALQTRRIGHTGTLDPLATGVLPLVIGRATRLASFLSSGAKSYAAAIRLGCATDTYDAADRIAAGLPPPPAPDVGRDEVERALYEFRGTYLQSPPRYSAKKIRGVRAYRLARGNRAEEPRPVTVTVSCLDLIDVRDGLAHLAVTASAGFYVRSLAHDLGARLGCGAHLEGLRRTRAGDFSLDQAVPLDVVEDRRTRVADRLVPLDALLPGVPAVVVNGEGARRAAHGNDLTPLDILQPEGGPISAASGANPVRVLDESGRLLAIARTGADGALRPTTVLV
jgi:tRNA pseudouridine55 synthase